MGGCLCVKVRRQLGGVSSLFLPCRMEGSNSNPLLERPCRKTQERQNSPRMQTCESKYKGSKTKEFRLKWKFDYDLVLDNLLRNCVQLFGFMTIIL